MQFLLQWTQISYSENRNYGHTYAPVRSPPSLTGDKGGHLSCVNLIVDSTIKHWRTQLKTYLSLFFMLFLVVTVSDSQTQEDLPKLLKVVPLSQTVIQLQFGKALEIETVENTEIYNITPNIDIALALLDNRHDRVQLFTSPLEIEKSYSLTIHNTQTKVDFTLPSENQITFGDGELVTFSGRIQDTSLIVNKDRKTRNHNAGAETTLLCNSKGGVFFVAFDLYDAFEDMGIRDPKQVLDASISLYVEQTDPDIEQTVILRRVLLPWKEGRGTSDIAQENELTYNSPLHRNLPWNKSPAQAMLRGIDGDRESDYNGSEDVAHRIDGEFKIKEQGKRYTFKSDLITDAVRFWVKNPDYNYGYLFALREGIAPIVFASKESKDESLRPNLTIRYQTKSETDVILQ